MRAGVSFLQTRTEIDPERIGLWGHSTGAGVARHTALRRTFALSLLRPIGQFSEIQSCRCSVLASLTRKPASDIVQRLSPTISARVMPPW